MIKKEREKLIALDLRKNGFSYSEILAQLPVAKSTLSLWLRSVGLSKRQRQRITDKKLASALRGALKKKTDRILRTKVIKEAAGKEVGQLTEREKWLIGVALYWAEGSKEKEWYPGSGVRFINSDPLMIKFFLNWLLNVCKISKNMIGFDIYIHENYKQRIPEVIGHWADKTGFSKDNFKNIYFKRNKGNTKRKNVGNNYYGMLKIKVRQSSELVRRISGWTEGIHLN